VNTTTTNDDPAFIAIVKQIAAGAAQVYSSSELYVFHVDTWFDFKWLRFIGKHRLPPLSWESHCIAKALRHLI
jgi:hypothetical protein